MIDREFRVGDRVTCALYGIGKIKEIDDELIYVNFSDTFNRNYLKDGRYCIEFKRTLFILPPQRPTKQQIKEKFKQLLDEAEEVEFAHKKSNYIVRSYYSHETKECYFEVDHFQAIEYFFYKYISKQDAERIVEEMNKFVEGE